MKTIRSITGTFVVPGVVFRFVAYHRAFYAPTGRVVIRNRKYPYTPVVHTITKAQ